ncbi:MAG: hypothetical protein V4760_04065, partial [Bdellovibrionota bacterium]
FPRVVDQAKKNGSELVVLHLASVSNFHLPENPHFNALIERWLQRTHVLNDEMADRHELRVVDLRPCFAEYAASGGPIEN